MSLDVFEPALSGKMICAATAVGWKPLVAAWLIDVLAGPAPAGCGCAVTAAGAAVAAAVASAALNILAAPNLSLSPLHNPPRTAVWGMR